MTDDNWKITNYSRKYDFENVIFCNDNATGLKAIIAIHDTTLGPAAGGCRMWTYPTEWDATEDAMRLARGMTYKYAAAGLNLGGGKTVVIGDPKRDKSESLFRALGRFLERLGGIYLTGEDVGTTLRDMEYIANETRYVITLPKSLGGAGPIGGATAYGVIQGMQVAALKMNRTESLEGLTVVVQGLGAVGFEVVKQLSSLGVKLLVSDIENEKIRAVQDKFDVGVVSPEEVYDIPTDIFSPCALGGILNEDTIRKLKCRIVAGSANNQLKTEEDGYTIEKKGIIYVPDYVLNAGGTIYDTDRIFHGSHNNERAMEKVSRIKENVMRVFELSEAERIPTFLAADRLAEKRILEVGNAKKIRTHANL